MILEISRLSQRNTFKRCYADTEFLFCFRRTKLSGNVFDKSEWITKMVNILWKRFRRRLGKPLNWEFFCKLQVEWNGNFLGEIFENFLRFCKFRKTEKTIISFASWNFGTILKAVVAFVVIEPTILKSLHTLFVLCNALPSVPLKSCFYAKTFAICVLFYQSLSTRIKTYWERFLFFYSLRCFALSNKWVKKVVLSSLKSSLRRKQLTR